MGTNSCGQNKRPTLKCKFLPCECEGCQSRRAAVEVCDDCGSGTGSINGTNGDGGSCENIGGSSERSFGTFITETISVIAFFIIATTVFWLTVAHYSLQFSIKIYKSGRYAQIAALLFILLLIISITLSIRGNRPKPKEKAEGPGCEKASAGACGLCRKSKPCSDHADQAKHADHSKSNNLKNSGVAGSVAGSVTMTYYLNSKAGENVSVAPKNPDLFQNSMSKTNSTMQSKNITVTITDSEAKEIFKQSKIFAIPTEMKQPPAVLVYLQNVILKHY